MQWGASKQAIRLRSLYARCLDTCVVSTTFEIYGFLRLPLVWGDSGIEGEVQERDRYERIVFPMRVYLFDAHRDGSRDARSRLDIGRKLINGETHDCMLLTFKVCCS